MRLSNSHRQFLLQATHQYASQIHLAAEYLATRNLSVEEAQRFHLGVVKDALPGHEQYTGRLAIPYITPSGVVDIRFRAIGNADPKYMGMPGAKTSMFNAQVVLTASDYICVTEGEIDCITMSVKTSHPAIGIPGANNWKPFYSKILDDFDTVIVLADGDSAGMDFGKKVSRELGNVNIVQMPEGHDVNSIVMLEGAEFINERVRKCLSE
ncbi:Archaeal primase DnaG/twinkle, TOPRIM domain [uncultured Caudovirales phage]|uniref:Archaeal primase DnaG/twinkle, TOPRIM domain n=1 Tax=uncultured Caudovirales phage TaxID=2100421 RepID=A0A6J5M8F1_9CAUD|nr:Archaeal primase DnaG/twinkle, TOPRIM domain [uncultured Caudovirales phage]